MFLKTLQNVRQGAAIDELGQALYDLTLAVKAAGKSGELVLRLKVVPIDAAGAAVHIEDQIITKEPKLSKGKTVFFINDAGELVKNDPRQRALDLKEVPAVAAPSDSLRDVG